MNIQRINYFVQLCETLHFTNTAATLKISQPALTKAIRQLEVDLGMKLIRREGKQTHLTRNGQEAFCKFRKLVVLAYEVDSEVRNLATHKPPKVIIAIAMHLDFSKFALFLKQFHEQHPNVHVDIVDIGYERGIHGLEKGDFDCMLTTHTNVMERNLHCIELYFQKMTASHNSDQSTAAANICCAKSSSLHDDDGFISTLNSCKSKKQNAVIRCTQLLWMQNLVKVGAGYSSVPEGESAIEGVAKTKTDSNSSGDMILAAFPRGRSDDKAVRLMSKSLTTYSWED